MNKNPAPIKKKFTHDVLNANFTKEEIKITIDHLKCNKSLGIDGIPAEILKACKDNLSCDIAILLKNKTSRRNGRLGYDLLFIKQELRPMLMCTEA